jgi:UDP-3-O-[3-hydroxymyristoyl] glucosamine N-acyltransferase
MKFDKAVPLEELARITGSRIIGNESAMVTGINEIHMVSEGDITFVENTTTKHYHPVQLM